VVLEKEDIDKIKLKSTKTIEIKEIIESEDFVIARKNLGRKPKIRKV
jgi:non-homologous end joining protein Ku